MPRSVRSLWKKFKKKSKKLKQQQTQILDDENNRKTLTKEDLLVPIATINATSPNQRQQQLIHKLRLCSILFDWTDSKSDSEAKQSKRKQLMELTEIIKSSKKYLFSPVLGEVIGMLRCNMFRPLRPPAIATTMDMDENAHLHDPSWPHLQIVYEFFLRFIANVDVQQVLPFFNTSFLLQMLALFDSQDSRERDFLKTILHRMYSRFMSLRPFIRKAMKNIFFSFMHSTEHNGISELLEILGSIVNGFARPVKEEHRKFLLTVLIPMHKAPTLPQFQTQLSYCVTQFVEKDPTLAVPVIHGLLRYWPKTSSSKELMILHELEEVLQCTPSPQFRQALTPLFKKIADLLGSCHFQVAEHALLLWQCEDVLRLIMEHRELILPIVYPVLSEQAHWNSAVNTMAQSVLKMFEDEDPDLVVQVRQQQEKSSAQHKKERKKLDRQWRRLAMRVASHV